LAQIDSLKKRIADLQAQLACGNFTKDLSFGMRNDVEVRCLQKFLNVLVTGNFFTLTQAAVVKFQEKYFIKGTGYVGSLTRQKLNQLF
jgi:peptidoglycan hydrolase-like protein with peptidoglycan-binding domain